MNQFKKLELYKQYMEAAGVNKDTAFPPLWRIFWRIGIKIPPPIFLGFLLNLLIFVGCNCLLYILITWVFRIFGGNDQTLKQPLFMLGITLSMAVPAAYQQYELAKRHNLGSWVSFTGAP
jgi:hypothetical protein